jgi:hypothetical protein
MISLLFADIPLPTPPTSEQFAQYGLAGLIFFSFLLLISGALYLGLRYINGRDKMFLEAAEKQETSHAAVVRGLLESHERVAQTISDSVREVGRSTTEGQKEVSLALREIQRAVDLLRVVSSKVG